MTYQEFAEKAHANAVGKGFWDEELSYDHYLMLIITEIAEMVEADRKMKRAQVKIFESNKDTSQIYPQGQWMFCFSKFIKNTVEDEMADVAIRLADLAGEMGMDFENYVQTVRYAGKTIYDGRKFTERAFGLTKVLCIDNLRIGDRILFGLDYIFNWAEDLDIDLWYFIEQKMRYNATREKLHGKKY